MYNKIYNSKIAKPLTCTDMLKHIHVHTCSADQYGSYMGYNHLLSLPLHVYWLT